MEDLKNSFIVDENEFTKEKIPQQIKSILRYCKVSKDGKVLLEKNNFTLRENLKIILVARFLANKLDESISSEVSIDEIVASMGTNNKESLTTRMKEVVDENVAKRVSSGTYLIIPFYIESILEKLEKKTKNE
jgi:vacuolar-type H+-ATPase subunit F/Vma7